MSIELKHLRYADAAIQHGSFRKAADALGLKQSNLSRGIRTLEERLGYRLFERSNGGVQPTLAGRDFLQSARRILSDLQTIVGAANAVARGTAGRLRLGFYTSLSAGNLRNTLCDYARRFPDVHISALEDARSRLFADLRSGALDIAIVTGEPGAEFGTSMALWSERILIALPDSHSLAAKDALTWADLKRERFVLSLRDPGPEIEAILIAKLVTPGESLDVDHHDVSAESLKSLVSAGRGITVVCESCMGSVPSGMVFREARDGNGSTRVGFCAYWMPANENAALRNFVQMLEERCPPLQP
ncbi:LysR family transcriptional regulator [Mesorhizobium sp. B2-4-8]|uniref:LysR family transcriptional regulator n=1 Tax=Mesorhizobium sp. B2-4-8 TaxID=2589941 RepID=UPI00112721F6|nr:LysR family transcriptional regulator [Mesorhizobium sp. B2-4-8]TPL35533.1 LysR family transcriptional regulator [Mesorhizobium sp. B2-4-8]